MTLVARARSTDRRYYGVAEGLVTDVYDPLKEGRVKVKFPWFDENMESEWCRVAQIYAGNGYGAFFIPEVGDEVLVSFVHGDMRLPVILGGLYNGKDKPPSQRAQDKDEKLVRTKGKHEILMDDSNGKQRVRIKTTAGHSADLSDHDKKIELKSTGGHTATLDDQGKKIELKTTNGHTVTLDDQGRKLQVKSVGGNQITLDDSGLKITVQTAGGQSITMDASGIKLTATMVSISATSISLGGDSATHPLVLGDLLMSAYNAHTHNCTALGAPTGPPLSPMTPAQLSTTSKTS